MVNLIIGTPDSGKSKRAEDLALKLSGDGKRIYLATMDPFGEEGLNRVKKHRKMREGKGFVTIECTRDIASVGEAIKDISNTTLLLECMANLIGNEMHALENKSADNSTIVEIVLDEVLTLSKKAKNMVIVSNEFEPDGEGYDEDTKRYVELMHEVNEGLKKNVDKVHEIKEGEWISYENN
jgi:adenosylcobinamide kinase/adenosylcobinamide-phosphate guanylyltransferase